ncbi:MAG: CBS domain-containing protein [Planctomycetes bacterium]|nr:CBS domain-containing protein [Planctomycetota bacterium]
MELTKIKMRAVRLLRQIGFSRDWYLIPLAAVIGSMSGVVALGFGNLVRFSETFFYENLGGRNLRAEHVWLLLALPAVGGLAVGLIKSAFELPMVSHGIPDVMESLARQSGRMKARGGFFTAINSALTLGSGGSTGQEGPIVQIGSVLGSIAGQLLRVNKEHMSTLVGCGAAAGLAAIFNAPIAGVLLVLEVMLRDFSLKTFQPVVVATVFGTVTFQAIAGDNQALFHLSTEMQAYQFQFWEILPCLVLGVLCGMTGWGFTRALFSMEGLWGQWRWKKLVWLRPALGGLFLGCMGLLFVKINPYAVGQYRPPAFFANGYPVIETLMDPGSYGAAGHVTLLFLVMAAGFKLLGTSLTLGSGGSGGIFAPSLFIGATVGAAFGMALQATGIYPQASPAMYALAGMAGVLSAAVHCPLTAFILVFELTRDYKVILPVMLLAITATVVSQLLLRDSIYTLALREMGVKVGLISEAAVLRRLVAARVPMAKAVVVYPGDAVESLLTLAEIHNVDDFVVCDSDNQYIGMVLGDDLRTAMLQREALPLLIVAEMMRTDLPPVQPDETLDMVLDKFAECDCDSLTVTDPIGAVRLRGVITRSRVMRYYHHALNEAS